ncbi:hypothetical protein HDV02_005481, partial [Globomyces sp. JEL0801]
MTSNNQRVKVLIKVQKNGNQGPASVLPPKIEPYDLEMSRCNQQLASKSSDLEKYIYLSQLRNHRTDLFYRLLVNDMDTFAPLVYTPTVGLACQ